MSDENEEYLPLSVLAERYGKGLDNMSSIVRRLIKRGKVDYREGKLDGKVTNFYKVSDVAREMPYVQKRARQVRD